MRVSEHRNPKFNFPFLMYAPENTQEKLPLIIFLHGAGERGCGKDDIFKVAINGLPKFAAENDIPALLAAPQCPTESFWAAKVESVITFIDQLKQNFDIDENRIYLTGISMGGYGTWFTAMARPDLFAAIAPICGGGMAWNAGVLNMPVWAFHGADDPLVSVTQTDEMVNKLKEFDADVTYTRLDGVSHDVWNYVDYEKLTEWMLSKTK